MRLWGKGSKKAKVKSQNLNSKVKMGRGQIDGSGISLTWIDLGDDEDGERI
jgi:hypothetical protein